MSSLLVSQSLLRWEIHLSTSPAGIFTCTLCRSLIISCSSLFCSSSIWPISVITYTKIFAECQIQLLPWRSNRIYSISDVEGFNNFKYDLSGIAPHYTFYDSLIHWMDETFGERKIVLYPLNLLYRGDLPSFLAEHHPQFVFKQFKLRLSQRFEMLKSIIYRHCVWFNVFPFISSILYSLNVYIVYFGNFLEWFPFVQSLQHC